MTYLDAAYAILQASGQPLRYEEITQRALDQGLIAPQGMTPAATMGSRLYTDTKEEGSRFVRAGHARFGLVQWQPKGIEGHADEVSQATRKRLAELMQRMGADAFETLIGELLIKMGFDESSIIVKHRADGGIDVRGTYRAGGLADFNAAVQAKKWKHNVQAPTVTQLRGSLQTNQQGILITTSAFSAGARDEAIALDKKHIRLIDGEELLDLLVKHRVGVVETTLTVIGLDDEFWGELTGGQVAEEPEPPAPEPAPPEVPKKPHDKPSGFTLFGEFHATDTWRGVLLGVCAELAQRHGAPFAPTVAEVKGKKRQYIAASPEGMISPAQIPGTELWVEANQSAVSVQRLIERLLEALGDDPGNFSVVVGP